MGERDLSSTSAAGLSTRPALLPAIAVLLLLTVIALMRPLEPPGSPRGIAYSLGAASLARDFDLRFEAEDETRFTDLVVLRPASVLLAGGDEGRGAAFAGEPLAMAYLAPFVRFGGLRGAWFAHALALTLAMAAAAATLRRRTDTPWRVLAVCLFGSVALSFVMEPRPEALVLAAVVAAFALVYRTDATRFEELAEVYDDRAARPGRAGLRWLVVGALLGFAALVHPAYLLLLVAAIMAAPAERRRSDGAALGLGVAAVFGLSFLLTLLTGGPSPFGGSLGLYSVATGFPGVSPEASGVVVPSVWAAARPVLDLPLLGWNLLFLIAGRSVGVLPYLFPVVLLLSLWEPRTGRSTLVVVAAVLAIGTLLVWPFDFAGDGTGVGNAVLLPVFGALWLVPTRRCPAWAAGLVLVLAGLALWPGWLRTSGLRAGASSSISPLAHQWLPHETTRRPVGARFATQGPMRILPAGGGLSERNGRLLLNGGSWGSLVLASAAPLESVYLAFDGQAGSELEVRGGDLGNTFFGADGGVGFEILLGDAARRHRMWWASEPQSLYDLSLRLPKAAGVPVAFRVGPNP